MASLLLAMMVARVSTPEEVGAWAIGYAVYTFLLTVVRSAVSTTALISNADLDENVVDNGSPTIALSIGVIAGGLLLLIGSVIAGPVSTFVTLFALSMPSLLLQDSLRFVLIRRQNPKKTVVADIVWLFFQVGLGIYVTVCGMGGVGITGAWALASVISVVFLVNFTNFKPSFSSAVIFVRSNLSASAKLLFDSVMTAGSANLVPALLGVVIGLSATGYFRGGLTLLGVAGVVVMGLTPIATVEVKSKVGSSRFRATFLLLWSVMLGLVGSAILIFLYYMPDSLGKAMIGESWDGTQSIIVVMSLQVILRGPFTGVSIIFRASHQLNRALTLRIAYSVSVPLFTFAGAYFHGLSGASWGWALSSVVGSLLALAMYRYAFGEHIS